MIRCLLAALFSMVGLSGATCSDGGFEAYGTYWLEDGYVVQVDEDGFAAYVEGDAVLFEGHYFDEDGFVVHVDEDGLFTYEDDEQQTYELQTAILDPVNEYAVQHKASIEPTTHLDQVT